MHKEYWFQIEKKPKKEKCKTKNMVKADQHKEIRWRKNSMTSRVFSFSRPAVRLDNFLEEAELRSNPGDITNTTDVLNEIEEVQEQSESQPGPVNQTFTERVRLIIHKVVDYCNGKEIFIAGFVLLCIQLSLLRKSLPEASTEEMLSVINKLIAENERFKVEVLTKIKDIGEASKSHKDRTDGLALVDGLPGVVSLPYAYPIYDGLKSGMIFYISGQPSANPKRFTLNFQSGMSPDPIPDIALHFDVRFSSRTVVRNSRINSEWGKEEYFIPYFPFKAALHFDMVIRVDRDKFEVELNGQHLVEFKHRLWPLTPFDTLYIKNDLVVSSINSAR